MDYDLKDIVVDLAGAMTLGSLLDRARERWGGYQLLDHWQQGEFHHDVVIELGPTDDLPAGVVVVATNCNGGVKEVLWFEKRPDRNAVWHDRCLHNPEFSGDTRLSMGRSRRLLRQNPTVRRTWGAPTGEGRLPWNAAGAHYE